MRRRTSTSDPLRATAQRGAAIERVLLAVCLVWIAAGFVWWLISDDVEEPAPEAELLTVPADPAPRPDTGPALKGAPVDPLLARTDEVAVRLARLAKAWMYRGGARGEDGDWLRIWLEEDPARMLAVIDACLASQAPNWRGGFTYQLSRLGRLVSDLPGVRASVLTTALADGGTTATQRAAYAAVLGAMGKRAIEALPALRARVAAVGDLDQEALHLPFAILSITEGSREVVPLIARILRDPKRKPEVAYENHVLGDVIPKLGSSAKDLALALVDYLDRKDLNATVRYTALGLLARLPMDPDTRRRAVLAELERRDSRFMGRSVMLLDGLSADDLIALVPALEKATEYGRVQGVSALLRAGIDGKLLGYLVVPCLQSKREMVRDRAVRLLPMTVAAIDEVLPMARAMLTGRDPKLWLTATRALGALTSVPGDRRAVTRELVTCVESRDARVRKQAVQSLLMFDDQSAAIVSMLGELLRDDDVKIRAEAVDALGELSAHEPSARAALERAMSDSDEHVRSVAAYWLREEGDDGD